MAITDEKGNKLPQSRIKKKDASRMIRERRMLRGTTPGVLKKSPVNLAFCNMCGFRVRKPEHESGRHHQTAPKVIEVNRKAVMA